MAGGLEVKWIHPNLADVRDSLAEDVGGHADGELLLVLDGLASSAINLEMKESAFRQEPETNE